ncbi:MAG: SDR family oxidoreductase [Candidatus Latescibacterota bacterium]|nr:SDR family oxidoreductase [Candidatus Latescibacterota bacterium]
MKKTTLVTGASSGIGLELARECAANGHDLVVVARRQERLEDFAETIRGEYDVKVNVVVMDLSVDGSRKNLFNQVKSQKIEIDYLINNAGFGDYGPFMSSNLTRQIEMVNLNIIALTELTRLFLPDMIARRQGAILNVASTAAFQAGPMMSVYFATKAFVLHFSEAIANEVHPMGVRVVALCPGTTESEFADTAKAERSLMFNMRKLPTSKQVARYGYVSMVKGKRVAVHGVLNKILTFSVRLVPRRVVTAIARRMTAD